MSAYHKSISECLTALQSSADPNHVEAWMRVEHSTLDWMDPIRFREEVKVAVGCIEEAGLDSTIDLARSMGLQR